MSQFTENQNKAINIEAGNILISAGAGSGKTTVLTERIKRKLNSKININELLVLTFTNAAAAEMKQRIYRVIKEDSNLKPQLPLIDSAQITTFDSFLINFIQKYGYNLDLSNKVKIGDNVELDLLLISAIKKVLDNKYNDMNNNEVIYQFFQNYSDLDDQKLIENFKNLYGIYNNEINKDNLNRCLDEIEIREYFKNYEKRVLNLKDKINSAISKLFNLGIDEKGKELIDKYYKQIKPLLLSNSYDQIQKIIFTDEFSKIKFSITEKSAIENKKEIIEVKNIIKTEISNLKGMMFEFSQKQLIQNEIDKIEYKKLIKIILEEIDQEFYKLKIEANILTFNDVIKIALVILEDEAILKEVQDEYQEILIDEYQDTNDFQNKFINLISKNNLYLVGDVKQSIYGFRNANPHNFNGLQEKYQDSINDEVINLLDNFRSREEVLDSVNFIFEKIMTNESSKINYLDNHALNYGNISYAQRDNNQDYIMDLLLYNEKELSEYLNVEKKELAKLIKSKEYEPIIIAMDIKNKIENNYQVLDNGILRNVTFQDFVILTRSKTNYSLYQEIFDKLQIPLKTQIEKKLNHEENYEVLVLLNIFNLLINKNYKNSLIGFLRSFLIEVDDQEIYDYFERDTKNLKIEESLQKIELLRKQKEQSLIFLITLIFREFDFVEKITTIDNIEGVYYRLEKIQDIAGQFDENGMGIEKFIQYLEQVIESSNNDKLSVDIENDDKIETAVNLMTIHKSKGLEFPFVYIAGLDSSFMKSSKDLINLNKNYGFIFPYIKGYTKYPTFLRELENENNRLKELEESIRLLYVGMTRAKEKVTIIYNKDKKRNIDNIIDTKNITEILKMLDFSQYEKSSLNYLKEYLDKKDKLKKMNFSYQEKGEETSDLITYKYIDIPQSKIKVIDLTRASKDQRSLLELEKIKNMKTGTRIHEFLEVINYEKLDEEILSIENNKEYKNLQENEQKIIKSTLEFFRNNNIFQNIQNFWTEYEFVFVYKNEKVNGIIDLLLEKENEFIIVDYKLQDISHPDYQKQLNVYFKYLKTLTDKKISGYLYSILDNSIKEVKEM